MSTRNDIEMNIPATDMVLSAIRSIQAEKRAARRVPNHVMLGGDNLFGRVRDKMPYDWFSRALRTLEDSGAIERGHTINDEYVREITQDSNNGSEK
ncbi:hypothetical protein LJB87_00900 [Alistipes sp. OttesenSCG-928-L06]|nr:hypothetical protein [Alistipes sp. OttesenSCG-928-L06]